MSCCSFVAAVQTCCALLALQANETFGEAGLSHQSHYTTQHTCLCPTHPHTSAADLKRTLSLDRTDSMACLVFKLPMASYRPHVCESADALCEEQHPSRLGQLDVLWLMCLNAMLPFTAESSMKAAVRRISCCMTVLYTEALLLCQIFTDVMLSW